MKSCRRIVMLATLVACLLAPSVARADNQFFSTHTVLMWPGITYSEPAISGAWVVYCEDMIPATNVWVTNLGTGARRALHAQNKAQFSPDISGSKVVWADRRNNDFNVYLYDLTTNKETTVTGGPSAPGSFPAISGNRVVYNDNANVNLYEISTRNKRVIGPGSNARIAGNWVVYQTDGTTSQIRAYNVVTREYKNVTDTSPGQHQVKPDISGSVVVWEGWDGVQTHVYRKDLASADGPHIVDSGGTNAHNATVSGTRIYFKNNALGPTQLFVRDLGGQAQTPFPISDAMTGEDQNEDARPYGDTMVYRQGNGIFFGRVNAPTVSITRSSATPAFNLPVTLTGYVRDFGFPIGGITPGTGQLRAQSAPNAWDWVTMFEASSTDSSGRYSIKMEPVKQKTYYRVMYYGAWNAFTWASHLSARSAVVVVTPRVALGKPALPTSLHRNKSFIAWSYIQPKQTTGSKPIKIQFWRRASGHYYLKKTVSATISYYSSTRSKYTAKTSLPYSGRWRIRAIYPTSATNAYTATGWVFRTIP